MKVNIYTCKLFVFLACEYVAGKISRFFSKSKSVKAEEGSESFDYNGLKTTGEPEFTDLRADSRRSVGNNTHESDIVDRSANKSCGNPQFGCRR